MADDGTGLRRAMMAERGTARGCRDSLLQRLPKPLAPAGATKVGVWNHCHAALSHNGCELGAICGRSTDGMRSLYWQSRPPGYRSRFDRQGVGCSGCTIPAGYLKKAAQFVAGSRGTAQHWSRPGPYHCGDDPATGLPCGGRGDHPLWQFLDQFRNGAAARGLPHPRRDLHLKTPLRGLDWLIDLWVARASRPADFPQAGSCIFYAGGAVYGIPVCARGWTKFWARADMLAGVRNTPVCPV